MDRDDEYRKLASEAQRRADEAVSDVDRAAWLRVVEGWLNLIRKPKPEMDAFNAELQTRGTNQEDSGSSH